MQQPLCQVRSTKSSRSNKGKESSIARVKKNQKAQKMKSFVGSLDGPPEDTAEQFETSDAVGKGKWSMGTGCSDSSMSQGDPAQNVLNLFEGTYSNLLDDSPKTNVLDKGNPHLQQKSSRSVHYHPMIQIDFAEQLKNVSRDAFA